MTAKAMPAGVRQHLVDTGNLGVDGLGRAAQLRTCPRCHQAVITGLDARRCAIRVACDPVCLDQLGEAAALLSGRSTYELWGRELEKRDQWKIAAGISRPVMRQHQCGNAVSPDPEILAIFQLSLNATPKEPPY